MSETSRFLRLAEPVLRAYAAEGGPALAPPRPGAVAAARRAYQLRLWTSLDGRRVGLLVGTPYHTPAHRGWTPAPVALAGGVHAPPGAAARWRVSWARGSGPELEALVQGLIDRDQGGLAGELGQVLRRARAEGQPPALAAQRAASWLGAWLMTEDIGIDEVGFAAVAAGLCPTARQSGDLLVGARALHPSELLEGDLALDRAGVALAVVERPPRRIPLAAIGPSARRARLAARAETEGVVELGLAHALPRGAGGLGEGPRLCRLWLGARDLTPLDDEEGIGFSTFYRPSRATEAARAQASTWSSPLP